MPTADPPLSAWSPATQAPAASWAWRPPSLPLVVVAFGAAAVSVAATFGLLLALLGWFVPAVVAAVSLVAAAVVARPFLHGGVRIDGAGVALLVVAGASVVVNGWFAGEHVLTDRDPGVYLNTAVALADEGDLLPDAEAERFGDAAVDLDSQGFVHDEDDGVLRPQFLHGFPVVLATVDGLAGHALAVRVPAVLGGLALAGFGLLARRFVGPWPSTLAAGGLGLLLVQLWMSRDTYSEALAQPLLWCGLLFVVLALEGDPGAAPDRAARAASVAGGLCLAGLSVARVEAPVLLPVLVLVVWLGLRRGLDRRSLYALAAPPLAGIGLWALDLGLVARPYWNDTKGEIVGLSAAGLAGAAVLAAVLAVADRGSERPWVTALRVHRERLGWAAAGVTAGVFVLGLVRARYWHVLSDEPNEAMQAIEALNGLEPEGRRTYAERTVVWLRWYLGWPAFVLAVAGLAVLARRAVSGRHLPVPAVVVGMATVPLTLLYLWRPSVYPDQLWALRRFAVATLPLMVLGVAVAVSASAGWFRSGRLPWAAPAVGWVVALGSIAWVTQPVFEINPFDRHLGFVEEVCDELPDGAVALIDPAESLHLVMSAPLRSFCGVPAAALTSSDPGVAEQAAGEVREHGGIPVLVTRDPDPEAASGAVTISVRNDRHQGFSLSRPRELQLWEYDVTIVPL